MPPRAHNLVSYSLALLVFAVVALFRSQLVAGVMPLASLLGAGMWCLHFARRSAESAWVHRYSKKAVPLGDVLTEYVYYWGFAAWNAWGLFATSYRPPTLPWLLVGSAVFVVAELGNAKAHRMLRDLRAKGSRARLIPRGFLFERVSCPHYLFEILTWLGFALVTQTWASLGFLLVGAGILGSWAHTRHQAYRKDFDGLEGRERYPVARRALIPGVF